jgi:hypothetical protein
MTISAGRMREEVGLTEAQSALLALLVQGPAVRALIVDEISVCASLRRLFPFFCVNETVRWVAVRGNPIWLGTLLSHKEFRIGCTFYFLHC